MAVCRKTLGWQKPGEWKNRPHPISFGDLSTATGLKRSQVARETMDLVKRYVLVRDRNGYRPSNTKLNLNYSEWRVDDLLPPEEKEPPPEVVPEEGLVPEERPGSPSGETTGSPSGEARVVPPEGLPLASKSYLGNKPKETLNKHTKENIYTAIFNLWNELKVITHKKLTGDMKRAIDSARKDYSQEEIEQAMQNYAVIVNGVEYYFNHKWTLAEFLSRRHSNNVERFLDLEVAKSNFKKEVDRRTHRQSPRQLPKTYRSPEEIFGDKDG